MTGAANEGGGPGIELVRYSTAFFRSNSHAVKHRTWTWYLSRPGASPSWANWISNSIWSFVTGSSHTAHRAPQEHEVVGLAPIQPGWADSWRSPQCRR
jgi:hypothetical protein